MGFRAATYNVLATAYIRPDWYPGVPRELLDPAWREPALLKYVEGLDADLLCLQEMEASVLANLVLRLGALGYHWHYEKKGGDRPDGCATFFRNRLFTRRGMQRCDYHVQEADSGHVALLLCLEHQGRLLGVANTHIRWDRLSTPREQQTGYRQVAELLKTCQNFSPRCDGWLVCGDFNRTPDEDAVTAMQRAGFAFPHANTPAARSCVANGRARLIDYIFYSAHLWAQPIDPPLLRDNTRLPWPEQPSDHVALVAEVGWQ